MLTSLRTKFWFYPALATLAAIAMLLFAPVLVGVKPVYLWTDRLIYLLVAAAVFLAAYIRRKPHLLGPWQQVFKSRRALVSGVVLCAYVAVGLLDSVHYRKPLPQVTEQEEEVHYQVEVLSLLDNMLEDMRTRVEKTYSAPFAAYLYAKETFTGEDGRQYRAFPRLKYGGAHLDDPEAERNRDILFTAVTGAGQGLFLWGLLLLMTVLWRARWRLTQVPAALRFLWSGGTSRTALLSLAVLVIAVAVCLHLSSKYHVFGTDKVGQDVFFLALKSVRTGLVIGTLTTLVMLPFAILLGIMAGYFRGWVDDVIQYVYTTLNSIPGVLLIAAAILSIQVYIANHPELFETGTDRADLRLLALCVVLGITSWTGLCRLLRGETLKLREMEYIQAATAFGVSHLTIIGRHLLPNVLHIVLIMVVLDFSGLVLAEAVLSYVGVGVDPSTISWGNMINGARLELAREPMVWWSLVAAFVLMFILVLAANLFSDAVRDAFDPRLQGTR